MLLAPVLPYLTDSPAQLEATVRAIAQAGAVQVSAIVLHLRPGAREWYLRWLSARFPGLVPAYEQLYSRGAYAPKAYQQQIAGQVTELARQYGVRGTGARQARRPGPPPPPEPAPDQLALL